WIQHTSDQGDGPRIWRRSDSSGGELLLLRRIESTRSVRDFGDSGRLLSRRNRRDRIRIALAADDRTPIDRVCAHDRWWVLHVLFGKAGPAQTPSSGTAWRGAD